MTITHLWLLGAIAFLIIEVIPPPTHFYFLCVVFGCIAAAITTIYSSVVWLPWVSFVLVSLILVPVLVPLAKFLFTPKPHASNAEALVGAKAVVVDPVSPNSPGSVKVEGETWSAKSDKDSFAKEDPCRVIRVEGNYVLVGRIS